MPYTLTPAADPAAIAECETGAAAQIGFTAFTSCIGIAARVAGTNNVCGVHLVIIDAGGNIFGRGDVATVQAALTQMGAAAGTAVFFGADDVWSNPQNGVSAAYADLRTAIAPGRPLAATGDGTYSATLNGGVVAVTKA